MTWCLLHLQPLPYCRVCRCSHCIGFAAISVRLEIILSLFSVHDSLKSAEKCHTYRSPPSTGPLPYLSTEGHLFYSQTSGIGRGPSAVLLNKQSLTDFEKIVIQLNG